jgi:RNA polymerase sigma factor (sigma-70 family)
MADARLATLRQHLGALIVTRALEKLNDAELLERFAKSGDQTAFETVVRRHGLLVLRVCQRVLADPNAAEDAFQATFLILLQNAASIRKRQSLACWLHGVAYRTALRSKGNAAVRRKREARAESRLPADALSEVTWREVRAVLDEEVARLPEKYRAPFVLCYLEGQTNEQAAVQLDIPLGSMSRRLARACELLRGRLANRGVTLSVAGLLLLLAERAAAGLPPPLIRAVAESVTGASQTGAVPARVWSLAQGGIKGMFAARLKLTIALFLSLGLVSTGTGLLARQQGLHDDGTDSVVAASAGSREEPAGRSVVDQLGDALPAGAVARLGTVRFRHGERVYSLALSPDGRQLASRGLDGAVRVWDFRSGKEVTSFPLLRSGSWNDTVVYSPDGKYLAASTYLDGSGDSVLLVWDAATWREIRRFGINNGRVGTIAWSPDGKTLAGIAGAIIRIWNAETGAELRRLAGHTDDVEKIAFSPDGKLLASGSRDASIRLWDVATGVQARQLEGKLVLACDYELNPGLRSIATLQAVLIRKQPGVMELAFSPDGKTVFVAASGGHQFRHWNATTGKELPHWPGDPGGIEAFTFISDGKTLASVEWGGLVRLWETASGNEIRQFHGQDGHAISIAASADGKTLAVGGERTIRIWSSDGKEVLPLTGHQRGIDCTTFSPDGRTVASSSRDEGTVCLWDALSGKELRSFTSPAGGINALEFSQDGKTITAGRGTFLQWNATTGREVFRSVPDDWRGARSPDGRLVCDTSSGDGSPRLREVATSREVHRLESYPRSPSALAFSPDGRCLAIAFWTAPAVFVVWDVATGKKLYEHSGGTSAFTALAFSPDGKSLASGSKEGSVCLWETDTGRERRRFRGHIGGVLSLTFSPDGNLLVSGGGDTVGMVWDVRAFR